MHLYDSGEFPSRSTGAGKSGKGKSGKGSERGYPKQDRNDQQHGSISSEIKSQLTPSAPALVIGITGATRSGKTTLAGRILETLGARICTVVAQDRYRLTGKRAAEDSWVERDGAWVRNWETPNQTDWHAFDLDVRQAAKVATIVIVEGYCLLHSNRLCQMLHGLVWVDIDAATCKGRRSSYPRGWDRAAYFSECIWPAHTNYRASVFGGAAILGRSGKSSAFGSQVLHLRGTDPPEELLSKALQHLQSWRWGDSGSGGDGLW